MVQFKNPFAQTLNTCFWRYLVLSPTFQRVLGEMVFEKKCRRSWNFRNFVSIFPMLMVKDWSMLSLKPIFFLILWIYLESAF